MKKLVLTLTLAIAALLSFAQIPQTFSYQAVVRDAENKLVVSKPMVMELSILQGSDEGEVVYSEKHVVSTNSNGLISLEMGAGVSRDDFSAIDWSNAPYFVKTVAEFDGKTITGITPLLAVPYALYAAKAGNAEVDLSAYATKEEIPSTDGFATKEELNALNIPSVEGLASESYVDEKVAAIEIPSTDGFATKEELNALNIPSVEGLASESYVNAKVAAIEIPSTDGFATKEELNALNIPSVEGLASETYVNEKVAEIEIPSTDGFATKEDLNALNIPSVEGLASESYVNEKVAAIEIPNTDDFATKEELNALNIPSVEGLASESYVDEKVAAIEIPNTDGFATKEELNALNIPSVEGLASESYVNEKLAAIEIPSTDGFATKEELNALNIPSVEGLASESYVNEKVAEIDLSNYYLKSDVDALLAELNAKVAKLDNQLNPPIPGTIEFAFSVSADKKIYFSQGNLQYQASTGTWRFAEYQYDIIGAENSNISSSYSGWIDMFGWGTSGYNGKNPYMTSTTSTDYGDGSNDIAGTNYDWGVYNAISNGGNQAGLWRTLTNDEWKYLINTRADASSKNGVAKVNSVTGLVLLPDEWTLPAGVTFTSGANGYFTQNTYSADDWAKMEANGAVFLPAAGYRAGTVVYLVGSESDYWSSSANNGQAYILAFGSGYVSASHSGRSFGQSVRLVRDAE